MSGAVLSALLPRSESTSQEMQEEFNVLGDKLKAVALVAAFVSFTILFATFPGIFGFMTSAVIGYGAYEANAVGNNFREMARPSQISVYAEMIHQGRTFSPSLANRLRVAEAITKDALFARLLLRYLVSRQEA